MWNLIIHAPESYPKTRILKVGVISMGRAVTNEIVIEDSAASRRHAELRVAEKGESISIVDLKSTNGTFVNHVRISGECTLKAGDVVRIGQVVFNLFLPEDASENRNNASGTHQFTRELLLESLDRHAVLLYEVARKLNSATDLDSIIKSLSTLVRHSLGIESCDLITKNNFNKFEDSGNMVLAARAIENRSAEVSRSEMFIPIIGGDELLGVMYLKKDDSDNNPFTRNNLHIAVAISHQASLAIQRISLMEKVRKEEQVRQLFTRFVSPSEVNPLLNSYLETGKLPPLREENVTILFADIAESTGLGEKMGVQRFASILNQFYNDSAEIIFRHNGMLKFLGDGVMAIFVNTPDDVSAELRAVLSGWELLKRVKTTGHLVLDQKTVIGVSINTGVAMVGYIGTQERAEFNALGDVVNIVFRMQKYARPNKMVAGASTVGAIVGKYNTVNIGQVSIRGRKNTVEVFEITQ